MKKMKRFLAVLLAAVMMLAMSTAAFADGETGTITIKNAVVGQTYTVYQILDLESYSDVSSTEKDELKNPTGGNYVYKAASGWNNFINSNDIKNKYVNVDDQGYVTWVEGASAADFAKAAQKYAADNNIRNQGTATAAEGSDATSTTVTFSNLDLGYYLVDSTLGTLCSLDTTNPDVTIEEKNAAPGNEKTVEEDSTSKYGSVNDADIGQIVNFKSAITIPKGSENIVFHDTMSKGLTLDADSIKVYTDVNMTTELAADDYTVTTSGLTDDCTFEVSFKNDYLDGLTADSTTVYVKYAATVNADAVVGNTGNTNTSKVSYGNKNNIKTTPGSTTTTYTWSFDVLKYANGNENKVLADAQFVLLNKAKDKVALIVNGKLTGWASVPDAGTDGTITWPANTTLTTDDNGKIAIAGLDADTYYLREIEAPDGYNKLTDDIEVKIEPTTADDGKTMTLTPVTAKVENKSGSELPSTGGMGTTIFYVIGGILVAGVAVLLITRKRMSVEK